MNSNDPRSSDFSYKKYSLEQLDNWVNDAVTCEDLTAQDIYDTIVKCVDDIVEYHKKELTKTTDLLSLLKGHRPVVDFDYTATGEKVPLSCDKDDKSPECQRSWNDFWEENYYPEEHQQYTEEELDAMCERAATEEYKQKCREYNLREAEYYDKRAKLDAEYEKGKYNYDLGRNKTYDQMIADGWTMTDDGFWIKEN